MTELEQNLLQSLLDLENAVQSLATPSSSTKPNLLPLFSRIDELAAQMPPQTDPSLRHYLQKRSYEKARFFLQGRDAENTPGNCGHV